MLQRGSPGAALTVQARDLPESAPRLLRLTGRRGALIKSHPAGLCAGPAFSRRSHPLSPPGGPLTGKRDPPAGCPARERVRQMIRWRRRPSAPIVMSITTFSSNCSAEPQASVQLVYAADRATSEAAGIVVTEMKTPMRVLARDSVNETTPTIPARTATTTENRFGLSIRLETGRTPRRAAFRDAVAIRHTGAAVPPPTRSDRRQLGRLTPIAGFACLSDCGGALI